MSISLCMIIKDEAKYLDKFLNKVSKYVDEIIIVDTGSTDTSKLIALVHTPLVYDFKWCDNFSSARNFSISKANSDWILWLDPDEEVIGLKNIKELVKNKKYLGYRFVQKTEINGKKYVQGICRLFQNHKKIKFIYPIHESVMPAIRELKGNIEKQNFSKNPRKLGLIGKSGIIIKNKGNYNLKKAKYYLKLLEKKKKNYPESSVDKEIKFIKEIMKRVSN
jgi:glycosyltransferase involved in cell wall biosynthesis